VVVRLPRDEISEPRRLLTWATHFSVDAKFVATEIVISRTIEGHAVRSLPACPAAPGAGVFIVLKTNHAISKEK
jgi:hypothetical protein